MGVLAEGILRGCQDLFTPLSLGYPLSVFNKKLSKTRGHKHRGETSPSGRAAATPKIGVRQRRLGLFSWSPLPAHTQGQEGGAKE